MIAGTSHNRLKLCPVTCQSHDLPLEDTCLLEILELSISIASDIDS